MEKRDIKIDLATAKDWYKKGGELREIALQAFTEKELTKIKLPKTWEEYCINYLRQSIEYYIDGASNTHKVYPGTRSIYNDKNILPSKEAAEAHLALMQLHQLRDVYRQEWVPNWSNKYTLKWCIEYNFNEIHIESYYYIQHFLSFQNKEVTEEFLHNFKDLIIKAKDLI